MSLMKPVDRNSLEEQTRLVSRYVAGDLSRSERAEFEAWLIASPELAAEVEMERRLRRGMASAERRGWIRNSKPQSMVRSHRWQMGLAASALLSVGLAISLTLPNKDAADEKPRLAATASSHAGPPLTVRLAKVRGAADTPDIKLSRSELPSQLTLEPEVVTLTCADGTIDLECAGGGAPQTPQYAEYEVDLVDRSGSTLAWRSARQQPGASAELSFTLRDPARLKAGDYDVVVRGVSPDHQEVVGRFWLKVSPN